MTAPSHDAEYLLVDFASRNFFLFQPTKRGFLEKGFVENLNPMLVHVQVLRNKAFINPSMHSCIHYKLK